MIIRSAELNQVCGVSSRFPEHEQPEFAFVGRSNVGKSSLLNALVGRRGLARTSSQPGKTATVNYYLVNGDVFLVDLPGYGYARISREEREKWGRMTDRYLTGSKALRMVFQLVDIRHEPTALDRQMADWLRENGFRTAVIATKADKLSRQQAARSAAAIRKGLELGKDVPVIPFSSVTKDGREEIWKLIEES